MGKLWLYLCLVLMLPSLVSAEQLPAGTRLEIRLQQPIATYSSKAGSPVEALIVAPVRRDNRVLLPIGAKIRGHLLQVRRVGTGLVHETAFVGSW